MSKVDRLALISVRYPGVALDSEKMGKAYQSGLDAGIQAQEAEILISTQEEKARVYSMLPLEPNEALIEREMARLGYVEGLRQFFSEHGVQLGAFLEVQIDVISEYAGMIGYVSGLRRERPGILRDYSSSSDGIKSVLTRNPKIRNKKDQLAMLEDQLEQQSYQRRNGYALGFAAGIARDFNYPLQLWDLPEDDISYQAFMQGLQGETRDLPFDKFGDKLIYQDPRWREVLGLTDERYYKEGLRIWITQEGMNPDYVNLLRDPEALKGYKRSKERGQIILPGSTDFLIM